MPGTKYEPRKLRGLEDLPPEVHSMIIDQVVEYDAPKYTPKYEQLKSCSLVIRQWTKECQRRIHRSVTIQPLFKNSLPIAPDCMRYSSPHVATYVKTLRLVACLGLFFVDPSSDDDILASSHALETIISRLRHVKTLTFDYTASCGWQQAPPLISIQAPLYRALFPAVTNLALFGCGFPSVTHLGVLVGGFPGISALHITAPRFTSSRPLLKHNGQYQSGVDAGTLLRTISIAGTEDQSRPRTDMRTLAKRWLARIEPFLSGVTLDCSDHPAVPLNTLTYITGALGPAITSAKILIDLYGNLSKPLLGTSTSLRTLVLVEKRRLQNVGNNDWIIDALSDIGENHIEQITLIFDLVTSKQIQALNLAAADRLLCSASRFPCLENVDCAIKEHRHIVTVNKVKRILRAGLKNVARRGMLRWVDKGKYYEVI